ncbi:MAG: ribonuclease Y [Candidatus Berkelbacteria bacterium]|nr:MAG: ribonuclease Y [Candidatus Berkelbacteria bacterium]QQG51851.1 MAG: ribonuclease Y [Candidatus Berkelbacteria bacterium]
MTPLTIAILAGLGGLAVGYVVRQVLLTRSQEEVEAKRKEILLAAKEEALKLKEEGKKELEDKSKDITKAEAQLRERESSIERRMEKIEAEKADLEVQAQDLEASRQEVSRLREQEETELEKLAKLNKEDARELLLGKIEKDYSDDMIRKIRSMRETMKKHWEQEAREIITTVIERMATEQTAEMTVTSVSLPNDEIKGKIIGKEGRNIQAFEKATGVDLVIDETPETVLISSFDPIRRAVAVKALQALIKDGRIQPTKIEELVKKAQDQVEDEIREAGEAAVQEVGITGLHQELIRLLGSMKFRTSYGQNQLAHAIEVAHIAALLAKEVGADVNITKKGALLHDIGKAISHEYEGSHIEAGVELARKYGLSEEVVHCIEASHEEVDAKSLEAILSRTADAISSARPGARRESTEQHIKRMTELENIANSFTGVEKSFAIQAGREIRVLVRPEQIDDLTAMKLARDIANKIEADLQYPGTVKVNVIRETRFAELAR